jgi:nucleotide-binding universal stress UspA family protein
MSSKILVAIDGSDGSKRALDAAANLAEISDSQIILAYVIDWSPYSFHTPEELEERHIRRESEIQRANDSVLNPEVKRMSAKGIKTETLVRHGKIANTLNEITADSDISQIYIGRQGETGLKSMIFGSVTAALVQSASVPVTVVP